MNITERKRMRVPVRIVKQKTMCLFSNSLNIDNTVNDNRVLGPYSIGGCHVFLKFNNK